MDRHTSADEIQGWFAGRLAEGWFVGPPEVHVDREEILVIGELADVELGKDASDAARAAARQARTAAFPEETRDPRQRRADHAPPAVFAGRRARPGAAESRGAQGPRLHGRALRARRSPGPRRAGSRDDPARRRDRR